MTSFKMPAGLYYIGDLCYVMKSQWDEFCTKSLADEGAITLDNGVHVVQFGTAYGDGVYNDQFDNKYPVDAGLIGCICLEDICDHDARTKFGLVVNFPSDFECSNDDGVMHFAHIRINTKNDDIDEEQFEEESFDDEC